MQSFVRHLRTQTPAPAASQAPAPVTAPQAGEPAAQVSPPVPETASHPPVDAQQAQAKGPTWGAVSQRLMGRLTAVETGESPSMPQSTPSALHTR